MPHAPLPLPPLDMRKFVGLNDPEFYDNPTGAPVYPDLPAEAYESVLDFGCGCGRTARQMLLQSPRPARYLGIDVHRPMVEWCRDNLTPADPQFRFLHHDVYSPVYGAGNTYRLADRLPMPDGDASLVVAHSVFTHLTLDQTEYYLAELARVLRPTGVAVTTWFFFDRASFPFLPVGPFALYADEKDVTRAVLYDREWFRDALRRFGLAVTRFQKPHMPGHQWSVWLARRPAGSVEEVFPVGDELADWVSGATRKPLATPPLSEEEIGVVRRGSRTAAAVPPAEVGAHPPEPPLYGPLAELAAIQARLRRPLIRRALGGLKRRLFGRG